MNEIKTFDFFKTFFKIGLILLGGGYVIVPVFQEEIVEKKHWITNDELIDFYCVAQCLGGIVAINTSILVGYKLKKFKGVLLCVGAMALSPIISIILIANIITKITTIKLFEVILGGVNLSVIVLIYLALRDMWKKSVTDVLTVFWFLMILTLSLLKVSPIFLIIFSIMFGIIYKIIKDKRNAT